MIKIRAKSHVINLGGGGTPVEVKFDDRKGTKTMRSTEVMDPKNH